MNRPDPKDLSTQDLKDCLTAFLNSPAVKEADLAMSQPLIDLGWRCDHKRKGISRADSDFIPLADLKGAYEALSDQRLPGGHGAGVTTAGLYGELSLSYDDIGKAIDALEDEDYAQA